MDTKLKIQQCQEGSNCFGQFSCSKRTLLKQKSDHPHLVRSTFPIQTMEEARPKRRTLVRAASEESSSDLSSVSFSPSPGDTLPWNLPKHHRMKRSKSASGDVLDPAERAVIRIAGTELTQDEGRGQRRPLKGRNAAAHWLLPHACCCLKGARPGRRWCFLTVLPASPQTTGCACLWRRAFCALPWFLLMFVTLAASDK